MLPLLLLMASRLVVARSQVPSKSHADTAMLDMISPGEGEADMEADAPSDTEDVGPKLAEELPRSPSLARPDSQQPTPKRLNPALHPATAKSSSASMQWFITNRMKQQLGALGYSAEETTKLDPGLAADLIKKSISRPSRGLPASWITRGRHGA